MHHDGIMQKVFERYKLGATGEFPEGKLTPYDEGEIKIAVGIEQNKIVIYFGKEIAWIGFNSKQAKKLADFLIEKIKIIEEANNETSPKQ